MLTKTKLALAAVLLAGTASAALADRFDPNPANRYPVYNGAVAAAPDATFQSAPVGLYQSRNVDGGNTWTNSGRPRVHTFRYDSAPLLDSTGGN